MRIKKDYLFILAFGVMLISNSCVKDLDFEQLDQVVLAPVFEADFIYSKFDVIDYIPNGLPASTPFVIPVEQLRDTVNYDLVGSEFAIDNLERIELTIEIRNTIEAEFSLEFRFLTDGDTSIGQLYSIPIAAGQGVGNSPTVSFSVPNPIVLDAVNFTALANATKIATEIVVNSALNTDLRGVVAIRSKATYYINYPL